VVHREKYSAVVQRGAGVGRLPSKLWGQNNRPASETLVCFG
jgi:hypothetical protein